jgi:hypothetical protein
MSTNASLLGNSLTHKAISIRLKGGKKYNPGQHVYVFTR